MAEGQGLEPWDLLQSAVFKTVAIAAMRPFRNRAGAFPGVTT